MIMNESSTMFGERIFLRKRIPVRRGKLSEDTIFLRNSHCRVFLQIKNLIPKIFQHRAAPESCKINGDIKTMLSKEAILVFLESFHPLIEYPYTILEFSLSLTVQKLVVWIAENCTNRGSRKHTLIFFISTDFFWLSLGKRQRELLVNQP